MLNRNRKEKFAEYYADIFPGADREKSKTFALRKLEFVGERIEDIYDKDICELQRDEIKDGLETIKGGYYYIQVLLRMMRLYANWCADNGICGINNAYSSISAKEIDSSHGRVASLVSGYNEFAEYLDIKFRPESDNTLDNSWRAASWLLFLGVSAEEIEALQNSDYVDGVICIGSKQIDITEYREAVLALDTAKNQRTYAKGRGIVDCENPNKLIKFNGKLSFTRAFTTYISKVKPNVQDEDVGFLSMNEIIKSGLFWRMKNADSEDETAMIATRYVYSRYKSDDSVIKVQLKLLLKEYRAWLPNAE